MIDKELLKLLGKNKKYIFYTVTLQLLGMLVNIGTTAMICNTVKLLTEQAPTAAYLLPSLIAVLCVAVRYTTSRLTGNMRDLLGRKVKKEAKKILAKNRCFGLTAAKAVSIILTKGSDKDVRIFRNYQIIFHNTAGFMYALARRYYK